MIADRGCRSQRCRLQIAAFYKDRSSAFHFTKRAVDITTLEIDSATAVQNDVRVQPELARIKRTVLDAVIQGKPEQIYVFD